MKKKLLLPITALVLLSAILLTGCCMHKKTEATCNDPSVCEKCGEVLAEALGHDFKAATCTEPETCSRCGITRGGLLDHNYEGATCTKEGVCKDCGATGKALGHDYSPATCTDPKICDRCGESSGEALGHNYKYTACNEEGVCTRCGEGSGDTRDHKYEDATCTYAEKCVYCGETVGEPLGHDFGEATCTEQKQCARCGVREGEPLGHKYENNVCVRCGETDPDSLPVGLETVHLIDSFKCEFAENRITDSFGYTYDKAYSYNGGRGYWAEAYSLHNLGKQYSTLSFSVVADKDARSDTKAAISVYVDGRLVDTVDDYGKTTGKVDLSIDVSGCTKVEIKVEFYNWSTTTIHVVNAELTK